MNSPCASTLPILLASSSPYRASLLKQLGLTFIQVSPDIDETRLKDETPINMVTRLSEEKARVLRTQYPDHIIIASDQLAITANNQILGKPGNHETAFRQLSQVSGEKVVFLTGLCVLSGHKAQTIPLHMQSVVEPFSVYFRQLNEAQINDYLRREQPFDCAGSFKSEGLGISLFKKLEGDDPNALIGLPLIKLCSLLENIGINILAKT
jgi:MAF protein